MTWRDGPSLSLSLSSVVCDTQVKIFDFFEGSSMAQDLALLSEQQGVVRVVSPVHEACLLGGGAL
jgi:hypothetical protein